MHNKTELGTIYIKDKAIKEIVAVAIKKTKFVRPAKKDLAYIDISSKNNNLTLDVDVKVKEGKDVLKITSLAQKNIADAVSDFTSAKVNKVKLSVVDFYN